MQKILKILHIFIQIFPKHDILFLVNSMNLEFREWLGDYLEIVEAPVKYKNYK